MVRATFDVSRACRRIVARPAAAWLLGAVVGALSLCSPWLVSPALAEDAGGPIVIPGNGEQNPADLARMTALATSTGSKGTRPANTATGPVLAALAPSTPADTDRFSKLANASGAIVVQGNGEAAAPAAPHWISTAPNPVPPVPVAEVAAAVPVAPTAPAAAPASGIEIDSLASRGEPPELGASAVSRNPAARAVAVQARAPMQTQSQAQTQAQTPSQVLAKVPAPSQLPPQALAEAAQRAQAIQAMQQGQGSRQIAPSVTPMAQAQPAPQVSQAPQTPLAMAAIRTAQTAQPAQPAPPARAAQPVQYNQAAQATQPTQATQATQAAEPVPAGQEDGELIHAAALDFLKQQVNGLPGHIDLTVAPAFPRGLAACATLQPFLPNGARLWGRTTVGVRCTSGHPWTVWLQAKVSINATYYVAARAMAPGEVLADTDLVSRDGDLTLLPLSIVTAPSQAVGSVTLMRVSAGMPLRLDMLKNAQQITAGQTVNVVAQGDGFQISSEGSALSTAQPGQPVKVRTAAGQIIMGIVKNSSTVEIQM
jgi:flagella basal body P-ring formation protein FlgA